jgi:hypothetical protein
VINKYSYFAGTQVLASINFYLLWFDSRKSHYLVKITGTTCSSCTEYFLNLLMIQTVESFCRSYLRVKLRVDLMRQVLLLLNMICSKVQKLIGFLVTLSVIIQ